MGVAMTEIASIHPFRRSARKRERDLQTWLDTRRAGKPPGGKPVPIWAKGARVEKAGRLLWAVVLTDHKGH